ncbi:hypothetical protein HaGV_gp118 [Helicoverpa armigera granulovirus]|uniref:Uncharacterized protein n=1 Tax=Helicoverpa armigera granulovirus TaxID=489830 RepID=A9YMW0_9BBAC|nr:hypothetical protein HaGV_gp118 [Helicoverpa armigera granulovirus]ABY47809.1 unknown [Helicoverpa armigera granulovirus]
MSIDLYSWSSCLDSQLLREHVRINQEMYDYLYLYCDGDLSRWNKLTDTQKIDLGLSVWRLVIRVCCRIKTGTYRYQLYVLTRFLQKLIPDSTKYVLTAGEAIELPYDCYIKVTYIMRYTFVAMGGFDALVRFVGFEALFEYCFEDPVDSCELGDFINLLASFSKHATLIVIVSVYIQVPVADTVIEYLNRGLCIKGPSTGKLLPHIATIMNYKKTAAHSERVYHVDTNENGVFELCFVAPSVFFENALMQYNTTLYENCFNSSATDVYQLTQNFNALQLLYELSWLVKEHWRELDEYMDDVYQIVISRNLWYVRLLLEPFLTVNDRMKMVFKQDASMDAFIDVLSQIKSPVFCSNGSKSLWKNFGNVYMVPVANYLKNYKKLTYSV